MTLRNLARRIASARDSLDGIDPAEQLDASGRRKLLELRRCLDAAMHDLDEIRDDVFQLQEQNQQLRKDLSDKVCARLCTRGHRSAG